MIGDLGKVRDDVENDIARVVAENAAKWSKTAETATRKSGDALRKAAGELHKRHVEVVALQRFAAWASDPTVRRKVAPVEEPSVDLKRLTPNGKPDLLPTWEFVAALLEGALGDAAAPDAAAPEASPDATAPEAKR